MRVSIAILLGLTLLTGVAAPQGEKGKDAKRFGVLVDWDQFPQSNPKEALNSAVKAINLKQIDYLLAHLADPKFVDRKVIELKKFVPQTTKEEARDFLAFQRLVKMTTEHFQEDPTRAKELARFAKDGEWQEDGKVAVATLKALPTRKVHLRNVGGRWVLDNRDN